MSLREVQYLVWSSTLCASGLPCWLPLPLLFVVSDGAQTTLHFRLLNRNRDKLDRRPSTRRPHASSPRTLGIEFWESFDLNFEFGSDGQSVDATAQI